MHRDCDVLAVYSTFEGHAWGERRNLGALCRGERSTEVRVRTKLVVVHTVYHHKRASVEEEEREGVW